MANLTNVTVKVTPGIGPNMREKTVVVSSATDYKDAEAQAKATVSGATSAHVQAVAVKV